MSGRRGILREISEASVDFLQTRAEIQSAGLTILSRYKGAILDLVDSEVQKLGIYVFVWPVKPMKTWANGAGLWFDDLAWRAEVGEDPLMNKTGLTAEYVAELIALHMREWEPNLHGINSWYPSEDCIAEAEDPEMNSYFVNMRSSGGVPPLTLQP